MYMNICVRMNARIHMHAICKCKTRAIHTHLRVHIHTCMHIHTNTRAYIHKHTLITTEESNKTDGHIGDAAAEDPSQTLRRAREQLTALKSVLEQVAISLYLVTVRPSLVKMRVSVASLGREVSYIHTYIHVCMYVCMYVCMCICHICCHS
jgi:hypothetical protein